MKTVNFLAIEAIDATVPELEIMSDAFNGRKLLKINEIVCSECAMGNLVKGECNFCPRHRETLIEIKLPNPARQMWLLTGGVIFCVILLVWSFFRA